MYNDKINCNKNATGNGTESNPYWDKSDDLFEREIDNGKAGGKKLVAPTPTLVDGNGRYKQY